MVLSIFTISILVVVVRSLQCQKEWYYSEAAIIIKNLSIFISKQIKNSIIETPKTNRTKLVVGVDSLEPDFVVIR